MDLTSYLEAHLPPDKRETWEMVKEANWTDSLKTIASRSLSPAVAGAGVGAFHGLVNNTLDARARGEDWGDSLRDGGRAALRNAAIGGALGAGAGAISPNLGNRVTQFGKGVLHSVTGWTPKGKDGKADFRLLGSGSHAEQKYIDDLRNQGASPEVIARLERGRDAMRAAEEKDLTNIPGLVRGLLDPRKTVDTLRTSKDVLLEGTDGMQKAMLGLGAGMTAMGAMSQGEDDDRTIGQRATHVVRGLGGMLLGAPLGLATGQATQNLGWGSMPESIAYNTASSGVGRLMDAPAAEVELAYDRHKYKNRLKDVVDQDDSPLLRVSSSNLASGNYRSYDTAKNMASQRLPQVPTHAPYQADYSSQRNLSAGIRPLVRDVQEHLSNPGSEG